MLTLAELLQDSIFSQAKVVAGTNGLNTIVEWSHIIDVPEVVEMVGNGKQLIITTGQGLPQNAEEQIAFIAKLAQAELAGILISIGGNFFQKIPQAFIDEANKRNFPIITVPYHVRFIDITHTIHEQVISSKYIMLKQSDHIHQTLNHIVLEGGGLQEVADVLAQLVHRSVTVEDPDLKLLAYADYGERDPARQESIDAGSTPDVLRDLVQERVLDKVRHSLRPVQISAWPEYGMTKERIVAPIVVERQIYGYLWLIASEDPLTEADTMTIERAASVAALTMLKDMAVRQTEARLQADIISQLLSGQPYSLVMEDKANRLGLDLKQSQRVLLLRPPAGTLPSLRLADKLTPIVKKFTDNAILQALGQNLILILPAEIDTNLLSQDLLSKLAGLKIGVGNSASILTDLAKSYRQAEEALDVGISLADENDVYYFDNLGFLHWLYHLPDDAKDGNRYAQRIKVLAIEEKAARAQLLRTLEAFLDCGGNAAETARILEIHRNTLAYRLKQIETYCELSLNDPEVRLNLQIAVKAYQLHPIIS